jgi:hypothetical protein
MTLHGALAPSLLHHLLAGAEAGEWMIRLTVTLFCNKSLSSRFVSSSASTSTRDKLLLLLPRLSLLLVLLHLLTLLLR